MKTLFIDAQLEDTFMIAEDVLNDLPNELIIACTVQYYGSLEGIVKQLRDHGINVTVFNGPHSSKEGQILGCDLIKVGKPFLYIGDGEFHPKTMAYSSDVDVFCYDPVAEALTAISKNEVAKIKLQKKGAYMKFGHATKIGVLVSTKPGQQYMERAFALEQDYPDKSFTFFLCDVLDFQELENYPFVEVWVNTACPRIGWDDLHRTEKPLLDLGDLDGKFSRR